MKTVLALILSFSALAAQEQAVAPDNSHPPAAPDANKTTPAKRVQSVTWDLQSQKLVWVIENGVTQNGTFVPSSEERYEISPQDKKMMFQGQQRAFTDDEAAWLQHLLAILTMYCAESTVWWLDGGQEKPSGNNPTAQPNDKPSQPTDTAAPKVKVAAPPLERTPGAIRLVARNMVY